MFNAIKSFSEEVALLLCRGAVQKFDEVLSYLFGSPRETNSVPPRKMGEFTAVSFPQYFDSLCCLRVPQAGPVSEAAWTTSPEWGVQIHACS